MTLLISDRAQESSTTVGTGTYTLDGSTTGFVAFSQLGDGTSTYYVASAGTEWEVGIGTIRVGAINKLERTSIVASSSGNAAVDWAAGTKTLYSTTLPTALASLYPATANLDADLTALGALATTGLIARTGSGTAATRTITQPAAGITVSNGDGVSGNPTLALANDLAAVEGLATTGLAERTGDGTWTTNTVTAFAKTLLDDTDAATARSTLGGTAAGQALFTAATAAAQSDLLIVSRDWRSRNALINGSFEIWQRGTSLGAAVGLRYLADRWATDAVGTTNAPSRQDFTLGQTDVPYEPTFFHRVVVASSAGAGNYSAMYQRVEGVRVFAGQTATVSFWAKADASKPISIELNQVFGTGGGPSATVTAIGVNKFNLTTSWQKFTATVAIPSITGKTLGSNGDDYTALLFWFDAGSNFDARTNTLGQQSGTFDIAQVQIEPGSVATPFERRTHGERLRLCQRYYEKSYNLVDAPGTATPQGSLAIYISGLTSSAHNAGLTGYYRVAKRTSPTLTLYSPTTGASNRVRDSAGATDVTPTVDFNAQCGFRAYFSLGVSTTIQAEAQWTADAEL